MRNTKEKIMSVAPSHWILQQRFYDYKIAARTVQNEVWNLFDIDVEIITLLIGALHKR